MSVLAATDAKTYLNIKGNDHDPALEAVIAGAEAVIARRVGPLTQTTVTRRVRGGDMSLTLPVVPAISLTSVTPLGGVALSLADLDLDTAAGRVTYLVPCRFWAPRYIAVYEAGWQIGTDPEDDEFVPVPDDLMYIIKELVRHLWRPQRGGGSKPGSAPSDALANTLPGAAYTLPIRIEQLLTQLPGRVVGV